MENEILDEKLNLESEPPVSESIPDGDSTDGGEAESIDAKESEAIDYATLAEEDLLAVRRLCPELAELSSLSELPSAARFGELRELGLSVSEALGAIGLAGARHDTRSHLRASVPRRLGDAGTKMSPSELDAVKRLFPRLSEREITRLYRRVSQ